MDFASLGLIIDATQVDQGVKSLDNLTAAAGRTEAAAGKNANAWVTNMQGVAASMKTAETQTVSLSDATTKLIDKYDPLGAKVRGLQADLDSLQKSAGNSTTDAAMRAFQNIENELGKARGALSDFEKASEAAGGNIASSMGKGSFATAGVTREFIVLGHEVMTGNFSRIPGSLMVMAERTGNLGSIAQAVLNPTNLAFAGIGAAVATMGLAFVKGMHESEEFNRQMQLTGNYAGITQGQFNSMAADMAQAAHGGIGSARDMLMSLASTGQFSGDTLKVAGKTALDFALASGASAADVVKDFDRMSDGVADWAEKHNRTYHNLTAAEYLQIDALEKSGQVQQAMQLEMESVDKSIKKNAENLGYLQAAWEATGRALSGYWDTLKKIGRETTTDDALAKAEAALDNAKKRYGVAQGTTEGDRLKGTVALAEAEVQRLKNVKDLQDSDAKDLALQAQWHEQAIQAVKDNQTITDSLKTRQQVGEDVVKRYLDDQRKIAQEGSLQADSAAQQAKKIADIREAYADKNTDDPSHAQLQGLLKSYQDEASATVKHYEEMDKLADVNHKAGLISDAAFYSTKQEDLDHEYAAQVASYSKQIDALAAYNNRTDKEQQETQNKIDDFYAKWDKLDQDHADKSAILAAQEAAAQKASFDALMDSMEKSADKNISQLQSMLAKEKQHGLEIGLTKDQVDKLRESQDALYTAHLADSIVWTQALLDGKDLSQENQTVEEARLELLKKELALHQQIGETLASNAIKEADAAAAKAAQEAWKHTASTIENDIYNAILDGGGNGFKKLLKDMELAFAKQVLQIPVQFVAGNLASMFTGTTPNASTLLSTFGNSSGTSNLFNNFGGSVSNAVQNGMNAFNPGSTVTSNGWVSAEGTSSYTSSMAQSAGQFAQTASTFVSYASALNDLKNGNYGQAVGTAAGQYFGGPIGAYIGDKIGSWVDSQITGETRSGGGYDVNSQTGIAKYHGGPSGGEIQGATPLIEGAYKSLTGMLKDLGSTAGVWLTAGLESSTENKGGTFAGGQVNGVNFGNTSATKTYNQNLSPQQALAQLTTNLEQSVVQALQAATDIPKSIQTELKGIDAKSLSDQAAKDLLTSISTEIVGVNQLRAAFDTLPAAFANLKNLSFDAADSLIKVAGGIQNLQSELGYFSQNFYTDAERTAAASADVNKQLAALSYTGITTKDQFRAIVNSLDLTTAAGAQTYATLLKVAPEFVQVSDAMAKAAQDAATAQQQAADAVAKAQQQYQQQYQQSLDAARSAVSDAYNRESSALQNTITQFKNFATALRDFNQSLLTGNLSTLSPGSQYQTLKDQFDQTYSLAKAGDPTAVGKLQGVAQQFLEASKSYNASSAGYSKDFDYVRQALDATAQTADAQANIAEQQLGIMQKQVAGIIDVNKSVLSLSDAIKQFMGISAQGAGGSTGAAGIGPMSVFGGGWGDVDQATKMKMVQSWYADNPNANQNPTQSDLTYWADKLTSGVGAGDVQTLFNKIVAQNTGTAYNPYDALVGTTVDQSKVNMLRQQYAAGLIDAQGNPIQHFESGGDFGGGLRVVGERGRELEATGPARIFNADQTRDILSGGSSKEVADLLRQVLTELRAGTSQRGAVGVATLQKLDSVQQALGGNKRVLSRIPTTTK